ncbi:unnamed protein product [Mytilus edulis]|uniref:Uncharacterized protein n=1 Tax=Mytilus edulis TaxID=6550 RepID=A0A8S3PTU6_MYTED|nr:unnamed protein product [Mytilus edulis]
MSEPTGQPPIKPTSDHYRPSCHNMSPHAVEKEMLRLLANQKTYQHAQHMFCQISLVRKETPINAACLDKTNFQIKNDTPLMKRNDTSPYYCQIQCQLAVTKKKWCDFVLFTFKGVHHERIPFDEQFWSNVFPKLASFYSSYVLPKLLLVEVRITHVPN